jgi:hypothetical protein
VQEGGGDAHQPEPGDAMVFHGHGMLRPWRCV